MRRALLISKCLFPRCLNTNTSTMLHSFISRFLHSPLTHKTHNDTSFSWQEDGDPSLLWTVASGLTQWSLTEPGREKERRWPGLYSDVLQRKLMAIFMFCKITSLFYVFHGEKNCLWPLHVLVLFYTLFPRLWDLWMCLSWLNLMCLIVTVLALACSWSESEFTCSLIFFSISLLYIAQC